ncbi:MAG: hypothetical protein LBE86_06285 [Gemmobacter sp.]|jgi:hypothetical protein|nr:hypothetical protein [Gemmobacter sp.]
MTATITTDDSDGPSSVTGIRAGMMTGKLFSASKICNRKPSSQRGP